MSDELRMRALTHAEFEAMVLDDLRRPVMADRDAVILVLRIRDKDICGVCRQAVDPEPKVRYHPARPQADHILERHRGGPHTWENLRLTHGFCNGYRNNFPPGADIPVDKVQEQLRLAVLRWDNPDLFLPASIARYEEWIVGHAARRDQAESRMREQIASGAPETEVEESRREAAHFAKVVKEYETRIATYRRRISNHLAKLGIT